MRFRIDSIATDLAASVRPAGSLRALPQDAAQRQSAATEPATAASPEREAGDTRIGRALEVKLRGQVLSLSRAAINAQARIQTEPTQRLHTIAEEIRGLAARTASGTLTDRERGTIERKMRYLERELLAELATSDLQGYADDTPAHRVAQDVQRAPYEALAAQANIEPEAVMARL